MSAVKILIMGYRVAVSSEDPSMKLNMEIILTFGIVICESYPDLTFAIRYADDKTLTTVDPTWAL